MIYAKMIQIPTENGWKYRLRINHPEQPPQDFEISNYNRLQLAAELLDSIPYKAVKDDPLCIDSEIPERR